MNPDDQVYGLRDGLMDGSEEMNELISSIYFTYYSIELNSVAIWFNFLQKLVNRKFIKKSSI